MSNRGSGFNARSHDGLCEVSSFECPAACGGDLYYLHPHLNGWPVLFDQHEPRTRDVFAEMRAEGKQIIALRNHTCPKYYCERVCANLNSFGFEEKRLAIKVLPETCMRRCRSFSPLSLCSRASRAPMFSSTSRHRANGSQSPS